MIIAILGSEMDIDNKRKSGKYIKESFVDFLDISFPKKIQLYFPKLSLSETQYYHVSFYITAVQCCCKSVFHSSSCSKCHHLLTPSLLPCIQHMWSLQTTDICQLYLHNHIKFISLSSSTVVQT